MAEVSDLSRTGQIWRLGAGGGGELLQRLPQKQKPEIAGGDHRRGRKRSGTAGGRRRPRTDVAGAMPAQAYPQGGGRAAERNAAGGNAGGV